MPFMMLGMAFILMASSCKTYTSYDDLMHLKKGMSSRDAEKEFDLEAKNEYTIYQSGATYIAKRYQMQIGITTTIETETEPGNYDPGTKQRTPDRKRKRTVKTADVVGYLLLFRNDRLIYWGFLQEFAKCEDPAVADLSSQVRTKYYQDDDD